MGAAAAVVGVADSGLKIYGDYQKFKQTNEDLNIAKEQAEQQKGIAAKATDMKVAGFQRQALSAAGTERVRVGASGVSPQGSYMDVAASQAIANAREVLNIKYQGKLEQMQIQQGIEKLDREKKRAKSGMQQAIVGDVLGGAGSAAKLAGGK